MTLAVDDGPMRESGPSFSGAGKLAGMIPFTFAGTGPERRGDFGMPEADGWEVELVSADYVAGTARYIARPE
jgi:hypothetical protein